MDIKAKIEEIVEKVKTDKDFAAKFQKEPIKALEELLGVDLPDEQMQSIVDGVKAKVTFDNVSGVVDSLKGLFGGKK